MLNSSVLNKRFNLIFAIIAILSFAVVLLRAKLVPFNHDETATFYYFIQNGHYMPFYAHLDTNNHILNSMLTHICYSIFGSSKFALRIPNIIFFLFLILGTYRIQKQLKNEFSKLLLTLAFLISYNWLTFFSVSRGYGLSFASIIMAISYLLDYLKENKIKHIIWMCFWMQLAMAASLIMMPVFCIILAIISVYQIVIRKFITVPNLINLLINLVLILYWVKFSSYLKEQNGLTHGAGESYWDITFVSLIYIVTGSYSQILQAIFVSIVMVICTYVLLQFIRNRAILKTKFEQPANIFLLLFLAEITGMFLMKKLMHINYPEDRTAFFFYITFMLLFVFSVDQFEKKWLNIFSVIISVSIIIHFAFKLNFRKHELYIYDTFPPSFYEKLLNEQKNQAMPITVGGHRCREFIYGFMNYRSDGALNAMDAPELLHMNCDYLIAKKGEKPFYDWLYTEIDAEPDWDFRLLKRKEKIKNKLELELKDIPVNGNNEFYEMLNDTNNLLFPNKNPIRIDFTFKVKKVPVPFEAWLVVQIDDENGEKFCFKRSALNWIKLNYNSDKEYTYSVVTPKLPKRYKCIKAFLWNIKQENIELTFNSIKFYQLYGKGINYVAPIYF